MHKQTLEESPRNHRGGQVSYLLLTEGQFGCKNLSITWVEGGPGSEQAARACCRYASAPWKKSISVSTDRQAAPPCS